MVLIAALISTMFSQAFRDSLMGERDMIGRHLLGNDDESDELANYPTDAFTRTQRKNGAFLLHLLGSCYMFAALALVCDEFFVPSLEVITAKLKLSDDVAGATFLAAGGSAPELATSFMGTFVSKSDVGFGTIVGSAVFNILFVIGACAWFSSVELELTWWPLFRDTVFYCVALGVLSALFFDKKIQNYEAAIMFALYFLYVFIMSKNEAIEKWVKTMLLRCGYKEGQVHPVDGKEGDAEEGGLDVDVSKPALDDKKDVGRSTTMHYKLHKHFQASAQSRASLDTGSRPGSPVQLAMQAQTPKSDAGGGATTTSDDNTAAIDSSYIPVLKQPGEGKTFSRTKTTPIAMAEKDGSKAIGDDAPSSRQESKAENSASDDGDESDEELPMDLAFPRSWNKRIVYIALAPLMYSLFYTIPDVRRPGYRHLYVLAFFFSVCWIGIFSFFMVWWITIVGDALGIPTAIMGLTILAIGTSVPDLLESIIVAKQGKGDMAVSSSLGSNIFDITVGLPLPWLLYTIANSEAISVGTDGLFISVVMLFGMLACCVAVIAYMNWRMSKELGVAFFILWVIFLIISLLNEYVFS